MGNSASGKTGPPGGDDSEGRGAGGVVVFNGKAEVGKPVSEFCNESRSSGADEESRSDSPMPDALELEHRFNKALASMDLPPDKAKVLKQYGDQKKWDLICNQERMHAKEPPSHYLDKLKMYMDPKASRSSRKRRMLGARTSTQLLRNLETSLRTNHIEWVREFLNEENAGLDVLISYLSYRQLYMRNFKVSGVRIFHTLHLSTDYRWESWASSLSSFANNS
jgi:hypothetical protein